jgi:ABC-2 type transport system permease protein
MFFCGKQAARCVKRRRNRHNENKGENMMFTFWRETRLMTVRNLTRWARNPAWLMVGLFQPILYLLLFAPLLDSLKMDGVGQDDTLKIFTPGLVVMLAMNAGFAGINILDDLHSGVIERLRVTPASRLALILGIVLCEVLVALISSLLLILVAVPMGFRANWLGIGLLFGLLALVHIMMVSASYATALAIKDQSALAAMASAITIPLLLLSGVLLPLSLAPQSIRTIAHADPFFYVVDAARALADGRFGDLDVIRAFVIVAVLAGLALLWATRVFRQAVA